MRSALRVPVVRRFAVIEVLLQVQFWMPVWFLFLRDLGFGIVMIVVADALFRFVTVVLEVPMGIVTDRVGRRPAFLALAALTAFSFALVCLVRDPVTLVLAWCVWGVQWALASGTGSAYLYEMVQEEPAVSALQAFGAVRTLAAVTTTASLAVAGPLYAVDPRLPFAVGGVLALLALPLIATLPEPPRDGRSRTRTAGLREVVSDRRLALLVLAAACVLAYGWSATILFQPLVLDLGWGSVASGWIFTVFAAAGVLANWLVPGLGARDVLSPVVLATVLVGVGCVIAGVGGRPGVVVAAGLIGFGHFAAVTALDVAIASRALRTSRATALSIVSAVGGVAILVARPSLGLLSDARGAGATSLLWAAVGLVVVPGVAYLLRRSPTARVGCDS